MPHYDCSSAADEENVDNPDEDELENMVARSDSLEDSPGRQLSEKSPLEPLDDEVEEAPLDREVPSKPDEPLPLADLGIAQSDSLEGSAGRKSQLSEKSPLEPLDDEVEEAPLDREVPSKPDEPLPLEDSLEGSAGRKSQLSEKSPLEPLDDEVEEAPLDREVPSKPDESGRDVQSAKAQLEKAQRENKAIQKQLSYVRKQLQKRREEAEEHDKASAHTIAELAQQQQGTEDVIELLLKEVDDEQQQRLQMQEEFRKEAAEEIARREDWIEFLQDSLEEAEKQLERQRGIFQIFGLDPNSSLEVARNFVETHTAAASEVDQLKAKIHSQLKKQKSLEEEIQKYEKKTSPDGATATSADAGASGAAGTDSRPTGTWRRRMEKMKTTKTPDTSASSSPGVESYDISTPRNKAENWQKYIDPITKKPWLHHADTGEYFFADRATEHGWSQYASEMGVWWNHDSTGRWFYDP